MAESLKQQTQYRELYIPQIAEIKQAKQLTKLERWFEIELPGGNDLGHEPGQFVQVSLFGIGEAPISVTSSPTKKGTFELCVRNVGMLTKVLHGYEAGSKLGIRGPFGNGFDVDHFKGKDILIVGGGIGIVPLRSLINYVIDNQSDYGRLIILYGAKHPDELLFKDELKTWVQSPKIECHITVDQPSPDWNGHAGVITTLIPELKLNLQNTITTVVGPPIMYKFVLMALKAKHIPEENIYVSLERRMKCGVGKCGHCQINHSYVCQDGPVYHYPEIKDLPEAI
ncbi:MAG: FAD/NAD(P)-binding protein [Candidatus Marinimicrobia bacterium]|nr:FAD/NAD(P)-binding protein [Candidatus Neomarinimicrobiota bacterium]